MKRYLIALGVVTAGMALALQARPAQALPVSPVDINGVRLQEGDLISANQSAGDPDIFIVKLKPFTDYAHPGIDFGDYNGFKRLFLNPAIFTMYGHLGGFHRVHQVSSGVRDSFVTGGFFRNCETSDRRIWATEVTGEDSGILHHVEMTGEQATAEDHRFFDRVFCINSREDNFYAKSIQPYRRLADVPRYHRARPECRVRPACLDSEPRCLMPEPAEGWCPHGCYYQEVQCFTTPCDPVLVCPSPTPTPICEPLPACARPGANPQCSVSSTGSNGRPWCSPTPTPSSGSCYVGGCSGQLCTDRPDAVSTCEWRNEYYCYQRHGQCGRQASGQCGWSSATEFNSCLSNPPTQ